MSTPDDLLRIEIERDYDRAVGHTTKFIVRFLLQVNTRGLMIESAGRKFAKFLDLPEKVSTISVFMDIAWSVVAAGVPALRIANVVRNAEIAVTIAKAAENAAPRLATIVQKIDKTFEKADKAREQWEKTAKIYENVEKARADPPDGLADLDRLDGTKAAIKELVDDARRMVKAWEATLDLLPDMKARRMLEPSKPITETMLAFATRTLQMPVFFSSAELDQLERNYLYNMIAAWAQTNVVIVKERYNNRTEIRYQGLNDTQEDKIMELFGPSVRRDVYFLVPPFLSVMMFLFAWKVGSREDDRQTYHIGNKV